MSDTATRKAAPQHVSIIMDGNGRWAQERGLDRTAGHVEGVRSVRVIAEQAVKMGIKYLSLYAFSEENWGRPQSEVDAIMRLMFQSIEAEVETLMDNNVRFRVLGNRARLSSALNAAIDGLEQMTEHNSAMTMIVFMSYSGKWDIFQAAQHMASDIVEGRAVRMEDFDNYLVTSGVPDPDLIIRTSGEQRLSNYLLWQSAYSEFYFTPILWPDFREEAFREAIEDYCTRDRRYGKVK